jgi:F-box and WD-40 domain protein 1/11/F-box/WD-40 domain protein 7
MEILDKYIYIGTDDKKVKVFNIDTWFLSEDFIGHEDGIT